MNDFGPAGRLNRRRALGLTGGVVGGLLAASTAASAGLVVPPGAAFRRQGADGDLQPAAAMAEHAGLPVAQIEHILQGPGMVSDGVLMVSLDRSDLGVVKGPLGVPFEAPFELEIMANFQALGGGKAILNGCAALKAREVNPFIGALIKNGLVFQAYHQHYIEQTPQVWHTHFRGVDNPLKLARALHNAIKVTSTPLPQKASGTKTPLNADRLARILGGSASVADGVVTVDVERKERIRLGGVAIKPNLNVQNSISFKPLKGDAKVAAAPDFSLVASEINPVTEIMLRQGWFDGCLYNQETDEEPQLYFSHMIKVGDPYELAKEIRRGLNRTNAAFSA